MSDPKRQEASIKVPSKDIPKEEEKKEKDKGAQVDAVKAPKVDDEELSPEDQQLKERLNVYVERIQDANADIANQALISLKEEIRTSTSSMTSVPKPLKFLKEHYEKIKDFYENIQDAKKKKAYADLMSILAMVMEEPETRRCLKYRLEGELSDIEPWGSQYVKHLAAEIRMEMDARVQAAEDEEKLSKLIELKQIMKVTETIVKFYMQHNSEPDACDLLLEVDELKLIKNLCEEHNHNRVCEYLRACASYLPYPDDINLYEICYSIYYQYKSWYHALRFALKLDKRPLVHQVMKQVKHDPLLSRQLAYLLGWHQYIYDPNEPIIEHNENDGDVNMIEQPQEAQEEDEENDDDDNSGLPSIREIVSNSQLSEAFHNLARDLDVLDPKDPENDIFKEQLMDNASQVISARKSLAITYVNAFVNAGFGTDKYMTSKVSDANAWIAKNKEKGQMAAVASLGLILLWDENLFKDIDRYIETQQSDIRAGAYLAVGISCSGRRSEEELAKPLLSGPAQNINEDGKKSNKSLLERKTASFGLGMAYAGTCDEEIYQILASNINMDEDNELSCLSSIALGLVYVGTCHEEISNLIITDLMERMEKTTSDKLNDINYIYNALALGLLFLGRSEEVETTLEATEAFNELNPKYAQTLRLTLETLAYAGTGNVLKIQKFLSIIGEHYEDEETKDEKKEENKENGGNGAANNNANMNNPFAAFGMGGGGGSGSSGGDKNTNEDDNSNEEEEKKSKEDYRYYQSIAVIGIALCGMGEDIGTEMSLRMFNHLIQYGNIRIKRISPLALALLHISNPKMEVSDILSKLSHDHDNEVAMNAILALGLIGAGTNNARIASMLRSLNSYYMKDADHLYMIRIAEGLIHMGKGLFSINPYHSDRFLLSKVSLAGILILLFSCIDIKNTLLGNKHWLLYSLVLAMKPRMLITLDESLKPIKLSVRVGQGLDVVGQAGKPKSITGFQTHETPVLLSYKDRAELATEDYSTYTPILEGFAIIKPNPDAEKLKKKKEKESK